MLSLRIALRFLRSSKMQTVLIVLGIAIGVSVQVFVGSLLQNLQRNLVETTVGNSSQITVVPASENTTITGWQDMVEKIHKIDKIKVISVSATSPALVNYAGKTAPVVVRGFEFDTANRIYGLYDAIIEGKVPTHKQVMLGNELRSELGVDLNMMVELVVANGTATNFTVSGFFDLGNANLNKQWVLTELGTAQELFDLDGRITAIEMQLSDSDIFRSDSVSRDVERAIASDSVRVENWKDQNQQLLSALSAQSGSSYMIQTFVLLSVLIGIASVLAISVVQKSRQIGILKAMGIKDRTSSGIFLYQGLILGLCGATLGIVLGVLLLTGFSKGADIFEIKLDFAFMLSSYLIAVIISVVAAVIPARKSSRLNPIEVIRNA